MNILIVAATQEEVVSEKLKQFSTLITGVGMTNTVLCLTKYLSKHDVDLVISMGIAGSFSEEITIGEVVEVIKDRYSEIGFEDGQDFFAFSEFPIQTEFIVEGKTTLRKASGITVNTVHGNTDSIRKVKLRCSPDLETMEGAAVMQVCEDFGKKCLQIRAISNKVEERNKANWNIELAIKNLNTTVENIVLTL